MSKLPGDIELDVYNSHQQLEGSVVYIRVIDEEYFVYCTGDACSMADGLLKAMKDNEEFAAVVTEAANRFWIDE